MEISSSPTAQGGSNVVPLSGIRLGGTGRPLRVGVLVDLRLGPNAGGHVKTWERLAAAALGIPESLDLTIHFSGPEESSRVIGRNVRYEIHPPVFSTARLPFLSHIPDHSDLGRHHRGLAARLDRYDVVHTTDGAFAFARTAARVTGRRRVPLVTSVHTDTPGYTRIFTAATVERLVGRGRLSRWLLDSWGVARRAEASMQRRLDAHQRQCAFVLLSREDDRQRATEILGPERVGMLRRGIDHQLFDPARRDRAWLAAAMSIPADRCVIISVGRIDRGKNIMVLARAVRRLADRGAPIHLLCAGDGADRQAAIDLLGPDRVSCPGVLDPDTLARAYASADLCAQPSQVEQLSNAVLEALTSGLPAIVAASSGSGHRLREGDTGVVVRGGEPDDWAAALAPLVNDAERRARMGRAARSFALQRIPTWRRVLVEDLLPVWRRAAEP
jgi:glycosyltransferase involved in cell wall biosynthesis